MPNKIGKERRAMVTDPSMAQREILERLLSLTREQERALEAEDAAGILRLSDIRGKTVREAAAVLPPARAWEPQVAGLVVELQSKTAILQQRTSARMRSVHHRMSQLTTGGRVANYFAGSSALRHTTSWSG
jgi:hypothetical protein